MKSKKIYLLRTAPYDYTVEGMDLYDSFNVVAKGDIGIRLKNDSQKVFRSNVPKSVFNAQSVYTSPRNSLPKTAKFISSLPRRLKILEEIGYVMEDFIKKEEFYDKENKPLVNLAREKFVEAFINNKLQESNEKVFARIDYLFQLLKADHNHIIVVITHGFLLKIIESYVRDSKIISNPELLRKYFNGKTEGFKFCEGFSIDLTENNIFIFNSYIKNKI